MLYRTVGAVRCYVVCSSVEAVEGRTAHTNGWEGVTRLVSFILMLCRTVGAVRCYVVCSSVEAVEGRTAHYNGWEGVTRLVSNI
jgi:glutamine amidotransferase-like uncharacterized protein